MIHTKVAGKRGIEAAPKEFWTNELEFNIAQAEERIASENALCQWLGRMSGPRVRMLCRLLGMNDEEHLSKLRCALMEHGEALRICYCVERFAFGKSEVAAVELARAVLHPVELMIARKSTHAAGEEPADEEARYDKIALLFAVYARGAHHLKEFFHFDKVHKKGFASMTLVRKGTRDVDFTKQLTSENVDAALREVEHRRKDGSVLERQGIWARNGRHFVFVRRTDYPDYILDGRRIVHGYRAEWIILDFSADGEQLNIASRGAEESVMVAEGVAKQCFGESCSFVNRAVRTEVEAINGFIGEVRGGADKMGLVEVCVKNSPFKGASKLRLSHEEPGALGRSLLHIAEAAGDLFDSLANIEWIKVLYRGKRVGLTFEADEADERAYVVRYTDHRLNAIERRLFEQEMYDAYSISILSTEKR